MSSTAERLRQFIVEEFLDADSAEELEQDTPLISTGILDSVATLKLITFLEEQFGIRIEPAEADEDNLDTIASIVRLVQSKQRR